MTPRERAELDSLVRRVAWLKRENERRKAEIAHLYQLMGSDLVAEAEAILSETD